MLKISINGTVSNSQDMTSRATYAHLKKVFCAIPYDELSDENTLAVGYRYVILPPNKAGTFVSARQ